MKVKIMQEKKSLENSRIEKIRKQKNMAKLIEMHLIILLYWLAYSKQGILFFIESHFFRRNLKFKYFASAII